MGWTSNFLSFARDERVVFVVVGVAACSLVSTILSTLTMIRDDNEIPPAEPKTQYITQETEDSLQLETLEKLLDHPNYSIQDVAFKILCDRAVEDPETTTYLLYGITRPDYDERMRCLRALALLAAHTIDGLSKLHNAKSYSALVRSLELSLDDTDRLQVDDVHWNEFPFRDSAEKLCLMFVYELIAKYDATLLIKAKFVEKWLAKQDWGQDPETRLLRFSNYTKFKDNHIVKIVQLIGFKSRGLRVLEKAGLINKEHSRRQMRELPDLIMEMEEDPAANQPMDQQARRTREHSAEERRLRRQHREAMVLNDGTRPFRRDDIIERDHDSPT